jgi:hypothetical protein
MTRINAVSIGSTGSGKTLASARNNVHSDEAAVVLDPTTNGSLARTVITYLEGNILYDNLSNNRHTLGYTLLEPSSNNDPEERADENERRAEAFVPILMRRQNQSIAGTPLKEEWIMGAILLFLFQAIRVPLSIIPFALMPGTPEFERMVKGCTLPHVRRMFTQLEKLTIRGLRAEVGSATRLLNSIFRTRTFRLRSLGGFDLGRFLQNKGKLVIERGVGISEDVTRTIMGAIVLMVIDHVEKRPRPYPPVRIYIDEGNTAGIIGSPEISGIAMTRKYSLSWEFLVQNLDFPGGPDAVMQNCKEHNWFGCSSYELARKAAIDIAAGLPPCVETRSELIESLTRDIMGMRPGHRWVRDLNGSRREYVPMLEEPWPDWPGLREKKLREKIEWIYSREEYRRNDEPPSSTSSTPESPPRDKSPGSSFAAETLKRRAKKRHGSSADSGSENESGSKDS